MIYRPDIDGLRGIAVLSVVLYHYNIPYIAGGFVGVDVFFVISGFLITSILLEDIKKQQFSLLNFYEKRIRRIFPALFALMIGTTIIGAIIYLPESYSKYSESLLTSTLFMSNVLFWLETGYFQSAAQTKPLMHTWSLSIEEQFYAVYPILLLWMTSKFKGAAFWVLAAITLCSFALSLLQLSFDESAAFYLIHTRFWELSLGGLIAFREAPQIKMRIVQECAAFSGFAMIIFSVFFLNQYIGFPGVYALIPCVGAALVIYFGRNTVLQRVLSFKPLLGLGLISYSLYLWHWPLLTFYKYWNIYPPDATVVAVLMSLSLLMAVLSWRYVEQPFRTKPYKFKTSQIIFYALLAMLMSLAVAVFIQLTNGLPQRLPKELQSMLTDEYKWDVLENKDIYTCLGDSRLNPRAAENLDKDILCTIGDTTGDKAQFILWGDSHAETLRPAFEQLAEEYKIGGYYAGFGNCPPVLNLPRYETRSTHCRDYNNAVLAFIERHNIRHVIMSARWASITSGVIYRSDSEYKIFLDETHNLDKNAVVFEQKFNETIALLQSKSIHVYLIGPIPEIGYNVFLYYTHSLLYKGFNMDNLRPSQAQFMERNKVPLAILSHVDNTIFIAPHTYLCSSAGCEVMRDNKPLYRDNDHISRYASQYISPVFKPIFEEIKNKPD